MPRKYKYVGSDDIRLKVAGFPSGKRINSVRDLENWLAQTKQKPNNWGIIAATFVIDEEGYLRIADRHSEHVACAGGKPVLSAGEIFFTYSDQEIEVAEISNQSTGFCPEPESWRQVALALAQIPLSHPGKFTTEFIFRRCPACGQVNIVKERLFLCTVCGTELPEYGNF
jgi:hypothetical protein